MARKGKKSSKAANPKAEKAEGAGIPGSGVPSGILKGQVGYEDVVMECEGFERYYQAQGMLPEAEWACFIKSLRTPLPTTFRFTGSKAAAQDHNDLFKTHFVSAVNNVTIDGVVQPAPTQLPWYPDGLGWQINVGKTVIRKSPEYRKLQQFLVYETDVGNLSRQEAVSMIPPLFMDVQPHHHVLDLCAAPGSKTAQLLEALHAGSSSADDASGKPRGLVLANDADLKRSHLLVHQSNRLPSANVLVTNLDASRFPKISLGPDGQAKYGMKTLMFDRILCDVPCSGDGTMRKNTVIWRRWSPVDGNGLHNLQLRILLRAMELLKPGGRLVYSTCSFNPIENEAVISAALNKNRAFEIIDVAADLPILNRRPGMTSWKAAFDKDTKVCDTYADFLASTEVKDEIKDKITSSLWPAGNEKELGIEKCMRFYPHDQDTGGFFVTVLEKKADAPLEDVKSGEATGASTAAAEDIAMDPHEAEPIEEQPIVPFVDSIAKTEPGSTGAPAEEPLEDKAAAVEAGVKRGASPSLETATDASKPPAKKARSGGAGGNAGGKDSTELVRLTGKPDGSFKEQPYFFLDGNAADVQDAVRFFKLRDFSQDCLYVRNSNGDAVRSVYYSSELIKSIILNNEYTRLRLVSAGVKLFARQSNRGGEDAVDCSWRACAEGLQVLLQFIREEDVTKISLNELKTMLEIYYPLIDRFEEPVKSVFKAAPVGSMVCSVLPGEVKGGSLKQALNVPIWKAAASMSLMLSKTDKLALSNRVFGKNILGEPPKTVLPGTHAGLPEATVAAVDQEEQAAIDGAEAAEAVAQEETGEQAPVEEAAAA